MNSMRQFILDEEGVSAIEYAVLAVIVTAAVVALGSTLSTFFSDVFNAVQTKVTTLIG